MLISPASKIPKITLNAASVLHESAKPIPIMTPADLLAGFSALQDKIDRLTSPKESDGAQEDSRPNLLTGYCRWWLENHVTYEEDQRDDGLVNVIFSATSMRKKGLAAYISEADESQFRGHTSNCRC